MSTTAPATPTAVVTLAPPPAKFSWSHFLVTLATIAPALVTGSLALANEAGSAPNLQTASDALHLATGVTQALASDDPNVVAAAGSASSIIDGVLSALGKHN